MGDNSIAEAALVPCSEEAGGGGEGGGEKDMDRAIGIDFDAAAWRPGGGGISIDAQERLVSREGGGWRGTACATTSR